MSDQVPTPDAALIEKATPVPAQPRAQFFPITVPNLADRFKRISTIGLPAVDMGAMVLGDRRRYCSLRWPPRRNLSEIRMKKLEPTQNAASLAKHAQCLPEPRQELLSATHAHEPYERDVWRENSRESVGL
jgi:hypothetical protein